ncbi:MAG: hypothetical protein AAGJ70_07580 [Pseudomonadota bacterium]
MAVPTAGEMRHRVAAITVAIALRVARDGSVPDAGHAIRPATVTFAAAILLISARMT